MHQYAGNPALFPTDFTIPDDLDDIDASSVDVAFEALGDRTANVDARVTATDQFLEAMPALNWPIAQSTAVDAVWVTPAVFDPVNVRWVALSGSGKVYSSPDGARAWAQLGTNTYGDAGPPVTAAVVVDELTGHVYTIGGGNVGDWNGSAWTNHADGFGGGNTFGGGIWFNAEAIFFGGLADLTIITYTTTAGVGVPTVPVVAAANHWGAAASSSLVIGVPTQAAGPNIPYVHSPDGTTWTAGTIPLLSGEVVYDVGDVAYGNGLFHVWAYNSGSNYSTLYTSPDGLAWTSAKTLAGVQITAAAMIPTPTGGVWFAVSGTSTNEGWFSVDDGATWGRAAGFHAAATGTFIAVTSDGSAFIATQNTTTGMMRSLAVNLPPRA